MEIGNLKVVKANQDQVKYSAKGKLKILRLKKQIADWALAGIC